MSPVDQMRDASGTPSMLVATPDHDPTLPAPYVVGLWALRNERI
jgi:hypothetical protein